MRLLRNDNFVNGNGNINININWFNHKLAQIGTNLETLKLYNFATLQLKKRQLKIYLSIIAPTEPISSRSPLGQGR